MYKEFPTPRRYNSGPENRNNLRRPTGNFGNQRNLNSILREKYVPKEYFENSENVDELIVYVKDLQKQLYESQCENKRNNDKFQQCQTKLAKYHELASRYKEERDEFYLKLYGNNNQDFEFEREAERKSNNNDKINITKPNDTNDESEIKSDDSKNGTKINGLQRLDSETKEFILQLVAAAKTKESESASNTKQDNSVKSNEEDYIDDDPVDKREIEQLTAHVAKLRRLLTRKEERERQKLSLNSEMAQLSKQLGNSHINEYDKTKSRQKTKSRRGLDDFDTDYDNILLPEDNCV